MADALTTGCKAVAIASGTYPASYTPASLSQLPPAAQTLLSGQGYTVDGSGCVLQNGSPAASAPIVAYVPGSTNTTTPTYQGSAGNCTRIASLGQPNPISASGVPSGAQVLFPVLPGSTSGSCTVSITTSPASSATPGPGSGLVPVQVTSACGTLADNCLFLAIDGVQPWFQPPADLSNASVEFEAVYKWNGSAWMQQMGWYYAPPGQNEKCINKGSSADPVIVCSPVGQPIPAIETFAVLSQTGTPTGYTVGSSTIPAMAQDEFNTYANGVFAYQVFYDCTGGAATNTYESLSTPTYVPKQPPSLNGLGAYITGPTNAFGGGCIPMGPFYK